jgi:uncharacterized protein YbjT (DUF2867 family)
MSRDPRRAGLPDEVEIVTGSPEDRAALEAAFDGIDRAFVVLAGDVPSQAEKVAAAGAGLKRLAYLSSISVEHRTPHPNQVKHQAAEDAIRGSGVPVAFLRPGPFHSNALWWAASIREERRATSLMGSYAIASIDPADIAAVGIALLDADDWEAGAYPLTGGEALTPAEQVAILAGLLGEELTLEVPSTEEAVEAYGKMTGRPENAAAEIRALHDEQSPWAVALPTVAEVTGQPPRSFRDWAAANIDSFAPAPVA